jgi:DNA-damage-inducible protein D
MADVEVFHLDSDSRNFESYGRQNGFRYWLASDLADCLGYATIAPVLKAVNKALAACAQIGASIADNFEECKTIDGGRDWKMSRFGCYLTVTNGDSKNPKIAQAQAYFITMAEAFRQYVQEMDGIERILIRGEISDREKALSGTARSHDVENFAFFQNAGYRGMYNMDLGQIRRVKGVPDGRSPLDYMGRTELAANLFRITQTDEKITNENIRGQKPLERAAEVVGKGVRKTMMDLSGTPPEKLKTAQDIKQVRSALKRTGQEYAKLDKTKK